MGKQRKKDSQFKGPDAFFIAKIIVPQDTATDTVNQLEDIPHTQIESQVFDHASQNWIITCYCTDYSLAQQLAIWHSLGNIEEFRII